MISVDGGATTQIDLRKAYFGIGVDSSSIRQTQLITALDDELERLFDARVGAAAGTAAGEVDKIKITDQSGRRIKVLKAPVMVLCLEQMLSTAVVFLRMKQLGTILHLLSMGITWLQQIRRAER